MHNGITEGTLKKITNRQQQILDFIVGFGEENGYPPTRRNITDEFGFRSPNAAEEHLRALSRKGYIDIRRNTSRGIILKNQPQAFLPIVGRVAAGSPILADQHIERDSVVTGHMFNPEADFLLRVQGESMINAGIFDGDLLAVHRTQEVRNNQIVVARLENEVTVKRFNRDHATRKIELIPENDHYNTIEVDEQSPDFFIEGISVGLIRERL